MELIDKAEYKRELRQREEIRRARKAARK
jgi:hypothetical protein